MKRIILLWAISLSQLLGGSQPEGFWRELEKVPSLGLSAVAIEPTWGRYPRLLLSTEQSVSDQEQEFWQRKGYEVSGDAQFHLVCLDARHLLLRGSYGLLDANGRPQMAYIKRVIDLARYTSEGSCSFRLENGSRLILDEGLVRYELVQTDEQLLRRVASDLSDLIARCHEHPPIMDLSLTQMARNEGYSHLTHATRPENLLSILSQGKLDAGSRASGMLWGDPLGNHDALFFSLRKLGSEPDSKDILYFTGNRLPVLVFPVEAVLDRQPFHLSVGYPYGLFVPFDMTDGSFTASAHSADPQGLQALLRDPQLRIGNELVTQGRVSLEALERIIVAKGEKKKLLAQLEAKEVKAPRGGSWEELIQEVEPFYSTPTKAKTRHPLFQPYSENSETIVRFALAHRERSGPGIVDLLCREYPAIKARLAEPVSADSPISRRQVILDRLKQIDVSASSDRAASLVGRDQLRRLAVTLSGLESDPLPAAHSAADLWGLSEEDSQMLIECTGVYVENISEAKELRVSVEA